MLHTEKSRTLQRHTRTQHCSKLVGGLARQGELAIHCLYTLALQKCQEASGRTCPDGQQSGCVAGPVQRACLVVRIMRCSVPDAALGGWHPVLNKPMLLCCTGETRCVEGVKRSDHAAVVGSRPGCFQFAARGSPNVAKVGVHVAAAVSNGLMLALRKACPWVPPQWEVGLQAMGSHFSLTTQKNTKETSGIKPPLCRPSQT